MHVKLKLELAPLAGVASMAMKAGLEPQPIKKHGKGNRRTWKADGPAATARFASLGCTHRLAWGGAKLMAPGKGAKRQVSRVMTLLARS